jgi:hypothetical protein
VRRRSRGERGAALVEAAIVSPVIILLVFGMIEFGLVFRDYLTVANTTRSAARVGSAAGADADADYDILQALRGASSAIDATTIEKIIVFEATSPTGGVPVDCVSAPVSGKCNHYDGSDFSRPSSDFTCTGSAPDRFWCPTDRVDRQSGPPDWIGVYVEVRHDYVTGLFGSTRMIKDTTVMRIEPKRL